MALELHRHMARYMETHPRRTSSSRALTSNSPAEETGRRCVMALRRLEFTLVRLIILSQRRYVSIVLKR